MIPRATYRLQFRSGMDFAKAIEIVPYLERLGVSHLYASPIFAAVPESTHGYDVIDNNLVEPAIGGMDGLLALSERLKRAGLGLLLDIVPNHMAASLQNKWWRDIVEWGAESAFAGYFDVDWSRKLTLPILADSFGDVLRRGEITLRVDEENGSLAMAYFDHLLPLHPRTYEAALAPLSGLADLARPQSFHPARKALLRDRGAALAAELLRLSQDRAHIARIHDLQPWRLMSWRDASHCLSYRRFFEITGLVGVRVEDPRVFDEVHGLTLKLIRDGVVDGLRVDHVDGLANPGLYLQRLREAIGPERYLVVEKILGEGEHLPRDWPVHGTTGYEFISAMGQVLVDSAGRTELEKAYVAERSEAADLEAERRTAKRLIATRNFAGELARLARLAEQAGASFPPGEVEIVLAELIAAFPVYRTYGDERGMNDHDKHLLATVAAQANAAGIEISRDALDWLLATLMEGQGDAAWELRRRFQQLSSAVMAKSVEDTLFYRWHAFIALNEVGSDPAQEVAGPDRFHDIMAASCNRDPHSMLATATHDTKRGEDARARLYALSERPQDWLAALKRWRDLNGAARGAPGLPDAETEWLIYQSLAAIWPSSGDLNSGLVERLLAFLEKALREAKLHTSWTEVNVDYERSITRFVEQILNPGNREFTEDFGKTLAPFIQAGQVNGLAQTLIKLTAPGVPDIYQGSEGGDFSLVDPDNRRPIDFSALADRQTDAQMKQTLISAVLAVRKQKPELFASGSYEPLETRGTRAPHLVAYARREGSNVLIAAVPRLTYGAFWSSEAPLFWQDTRIILPARDHKTRFRHVVSGKSLDPGCEIYAGELLRSLPCGSIVSVPDTGS